MMAKIEKRTARRMRRIVRVRTKTIRGIGGRIRPLGKTGGRIEPLANGMPWSEGGKIGKRGTGVARTKIVRTTSLPATRSAGSARRPALKGLVVMLTANILRPLLRLSSLSRRQR
jgi:hypothetical protein